MKLHVTRLGPLVGAFALLTACTAARKQQVLTFFFDGAPAVNPVAALGVAPAAVPLATASAPLPDLYLAARAAPPGVRHQPYAERQCLSCHESQFSEKLRGTVAELCQLCHKSVFERRPFGHAPVEAGDCLGCHHPHESLEPALLLKPSRQLCAECHAEELIVDSPAHATIEQDACQVCHDPHGGQHLHFLKERRRDPPAAPLAAGLSR